MDILDIDEALKDDSYIFLADKTHDDISNILQQWKTNNQPQQQLPPHAQQFQYNNEQAYKLNSKTFTRPKRRSHLAQNLETQFAHTQNALPGPPMFHLEIGGLVTNMQRSFLQDTSPPSSICSSINLNEGMNSSLITSADFTNLNFLQSTQSLEPDFNLTTTTGIDGYTLNDMIRDRKALESLTMSGDGTLIKDSQIAQIDEISLALSKTASGCSTMDNSTDSMSTANEVGLKGPLQRTMVLSEEMIGDTTFSLVESLNTPTLEAQPQLDGTFKKPAALDETQLLAGRQVNTTFTDAGLGEATEARCETPENVEKKLADLNFQSTPLTIGGRKQYPSSNNNNNKQQFTPTLSWRGEGDVNLSPIVGTPFKAATTTTRLLNNTYEGPQPSAAGNTFSAAAPSFDGNKFVMDTMEQLEHIEQPLDGTYNMAEKSEQEQVEMLAQHKQMQCVLDLAEAEVELLAQQGDEEQFEHMLAKLGQVNALKPEQVKMQKSLETIKRRFNSSQVATTTAVDEVQATVAPEAHSSGISNSVLLSSHSGLSGSGCSSSNTSGGERLLSRRSRLYDDVNLSAMQASNGSANSCNSTSYIVQRRVEEVEQNTDEACTPLEEETSPATPATAVAVAAAPAPVETESANYKLAERRERDRERFKTIKISNEMRQKQHELVVPCIDDDIDDVVSQEVEQLDQPEQQEIPQQRLSRREMSAVYHNNNNNNEDNKPEMKNYLTYKKPKAAGGSSRRPLPEVAHEMTRPEPRSLSRPRYISGLQKFTTVSKATSAGAGLNANPPATGNGGASRMMMAGGAVGAATGELKSPMGIKSKSFHNLSSNVMGSGVGAGALPRASVGSGLRRPGAAATKLQSGLRAQQANQEESNALFKVPKTVSGLRAPANAAKRAVGNGLARPSSGYYSLSVAGKGPAEPDTPESLSSASSRGSLYGKDNGKSNVREPQNAFDDQTLTSKLTQVTTGATGIPKPSGLRQPTQMKRSGLPRPSSIVRR